MARPPEITDDEIITAGHALEAAGQPVSAYRLYTGVGSRGRADRLLSVWTAHVAARSSAETQEPPALPPAVRDSLAEAVRSMGEAVERAVRGIAADLATEAAARTAAERDALARERAALAETEADALRAFTGVTDELEGLRAENVRLAEELRRAEVTREAAETVRHLAVDQLTAAHAARTEALLDAARVCERAAAAERRIAELEADLLTLRRGTSDGIRPPRLAAKLDEDDAPTVGGPRRRTSGSTRLQNAGRRAGGHQAAVNGRAATDANNTPVPV